MMKRVLDLVLAAAALLILSPVLALALLWVRLDSPGPLLFRQVRVGKEMKPFQILKIRSMAEREHVEQLSEAVIAGGHDPRVTRAGRVLRATSLDELPQLWNVLRGDMSLVGPRPLLPEQVQAVPLRFRKRFAVRPGLTGLAQVRGRRSLSWLDQLAADLDYAESHGPGRDIWIMAQTVVVVLTGKGVYPNGAQNWRAFLQEHGPQGEVPERRE